MSENPWHKILILRRLDRQLVRFAISTRDFNNRFQIDAHPGVFARRADADFDVAEGRFD
jgi:hypothetical protein